MNPTASRIGVSDINEAQVVDDYAVTAEFYDLWARGHWKALSPSLRAALGSDIDCRAGPMVDLGAGSGWGTLAIADAVPGATIIAVEPSRAMRTVLFSRLMDRPEVCERVTVVESRLQSLDWPERISGFVAMGMLGHLTSIERRELWRQLADRLAPRAPAIIQLQSPDRPVKVPLVRHSVVEVGDRSYEGWCTATPVGRRALRWTLRCTVRQEDRVIDEHVSHSVFRTVSADDVRSEAAAVGLHTAESSGGLITLRRR